MFRPTPAEIATILKSPLRNVELYWPGQLEQLLKYGIHYDSGIIAALATISVEAREFKPINEYGGPKYFFNMYDIGSPDPKRRAKAIELGNTSPGDGVKYHGRGKIQYTGKTNYSVLSKEVGIDLVKNPERILEPKVDDVAFAFYFRGHGVDFWAQRALTSTLPKCLGCSNNGLFMNPFGSLRTPQPKHQVCPECGWKTVRRKVNGGLNHYLEFKQSADALIKLMCSKQH